MKMGELTREEMDGVLQRQTVAHLGCQRGGRPYVLPLNYAWDGEAVYVHALGGAKIDIMRENPQVCVQVDEVEGPISWRSVVGWGRFEELRGDGAARAMQILVDRLAPPNPNGWADPFVPPLIADKVVLFRVRLAETSGRYATP
jgi:nitroimidazol reductase NimA-like FMN-containing flavoprotein (pyridoxamine 5'-phosphate oxidase superfamily)